jgi:hypothetical protein
LQYPLLLGRELEFLDDLAKKRQREKTIFH